MLAEVSIETERLILRTVTEDDLVEVASSWDLIDGRISDQEAAQKINWMQNNHTRNRPGHLIHLCLAVIAKDTGEFIGWCGLDHRDRSKNNPVLFYLLKANRWGKGLATEAAHALLRFAFKDLALDRVDASAAVENIASRRVMEKIGMQFQGFDQEGGVLFTMSREGFVNQIRQE